MLIRERSAIAHRTACGNDGIEAAVVVACLMQAAVVAVAVVA